MAVGPSPSAYICGRNSSSASIGGSPLASICGKFGPGGWRFRGGEHAHPPQRFICGLSVSVLMVRPVTLSTTRGTHQPPGLKIVCLLAALPEPIIAAGGVARRRWFNISTTACAGSLARPSPNRHRQREFVLRTRNSGGSQSNGPARTWGPRFSTRLRTNKHRTVGFPVRA